MLRLDFDLLIKFKEKNKLKILDHDLLLKIEVYVKLWSWRCKISKLVLSVCVVQSRSLKTRRDSKAGVSTGSTFACVKQFTCNRNRDLNTCKVPNLCGCLIGNILEDIHISRKRIKPLERLRNLETAQQLRFQVESFKFQISSFTWKHSRFILSSRIFSILTVCSPPSSSRRTHIRTKKSCKAWIGRSDYHPWNGWESPQRSAKWIYYFE